MRGRAREWGADLKRDLLVLKGDILVLKGGLLVSQVCADARENGVPNACVLMRMCVSKRPISLYIRPISA